MYSLNKIITTVTLIGAFAFLTLSSTARAVDPPPVGGYPNGNTATGEDALFSLTTGFENTAIGHDALRNLTTGKHNTATGYETLSASTTGYNNTANGWESLNANTTGFKNTADGCDTLIANTTGFQNTAIGVAALKRNKTGSNNTANGWEALSNNTIGASNIALGASAGSSLTSGSNNIDIGNVGSAGESNTVRIGTGGTQTNTYIAGITGVTVAEGIGVIVDASGHLGTVTSSERFKDLIAPMDKASESILSLKPATFRYKREFDPNGVPQFGLVAEEVEKVNPHLVVRDKAGKPYSVRYEAVNAMLLNEFLKEHRKVEEQSSHIIKQDGTVQTLEATVAQQQAQINALMATVKTQAKRIRKVSDQLNPGNPRIVVNN